MVTKEFDERVRSGAFAYLRAVQLRTGGPVRYGDVAGYEVDGKSIPLMATQQGIRKPAILDAALSIRSVYASSPDKRPYDDSIGPDGSLRYKWRGTDPQHAENRALRVAYRDRLPLILFNGIGDALYAPIYPVWLIGEEPQSHQFIVALDNEQLVFGSADGVIDLDLRRRYSERIVRERLHQPMFRARVLSAYGGQCAICRLRHAELLDAAHIRADIDGGAPVVPNGIALCKIHHAAYDENILGIKPDYKIVVRQDILGESDGPTLRHALQEMHGVRIDVPAKRLARPDQDLLAERYEHFSQAS